MIEEAATNLVKPVVNISKYSFLF